MKVAIAGYGVEGKASYDYWREKGDQVVIVDERLDIDAPEEASTILGPNAFTQLEDFEVIVRSPSLNPRKLPYGDKVWSATNEFFANSPTKNIIGVTGTKGKGTTSSLIASILRAAGKPVHLVGNIGTPALAELPKIGSEDFVVYELSSFQLWDVKRSPHVAVVLGIEPDHLDVHDDLEDYIAAKTRIVRFQNSEDAVVYNETNETSRLIAGQSAGEKRPYPFPIDKFTDSLKLPGKHNQENAAAAIAALRDYVDDPKAIKKGLADFPGLPHRLKFVREIGGVKFYDDSIATTPGSAIAAMNSFTVPKVIILGGFDKGADYEKIVEVCRQSNTKVIAIGTTGQTIADLCNQLGVVCAPVFDGGMTDIVAKAYEVAKSGEVVILSPASSSFDMFKSYSDRGDQFIAAVNQLAD